MFKALFILILFYSVTGFTQPKTRIVYRDAADFDFSYLQQEMNKKASENGRSSGKKTVESKEAAEKRKAAMSQLKTMMSTTLADTIAAWNEGDFVFTRSVLDDAGTTTLYSQSSNRILVIKNNDNQPANGSDTIFSRSQNCNGVPDCGYESKLVSKNGSRVILGFSCVNYSIGYKAQDGNIREKFSIWVTDQITPALPAYAIMRLPAKILSGYTALEIKEFFDEESSSNSVKKAISIAH